MKMKLTLGEVDFQVDLSSPLNLAIKLEFCGPQPNHFGAPKAQFTTLEGQGFVGDTSRGGSCNVVALNLIPHCNGTHTETVHHVCDQAFYISQVLEQGLFAATLISLEPVAGQQTDESYRPNLAADDRVITRKMLQDKLTSVPDELLQALIIRTLPNGDWKKECTYGEAQVPPFLTLDAAQYLVERDIHHLLVDMPSVDRMYDQGHLSVHRVFWNLPADGHKAEQDVCGHKTITEMIYVPGEVSDGAYLLNLQTPAFNLDAAPSRPQIYPLLPEW